MSLVTVAIDPGTSLTKCIYQIDGNAPKFLALPPESVELTAEFTGAVESHCKSANIYGTGAASTAWYKVKKQGNIFATGMLAQKYQLGVDIKRLKYESAEVKIVAIVGIIAQREELDEFSLHIAMLLPYGEYQDEEKLQAKVAKILSSGFYWQGRTKIKADLTHWVCYPEGSGRMFSYIEEVGDRQFESENVAILMLGHRNGSILQMSGGMVVEGSESSDKYGFYQFLHYILEQKSGYDVQDLLDAISVELSDSWRTSSKPTRYYIDARKIAESRNRNEDNIQQETEELEAAINAARLQYIGSLQAWIAEKLRTFDLDKILFCGGACLFFKETLQKLEVSRVPDVVGIFRESLDPYEDKLIEDLVKELGLNANQKKSFSYRFVDVYLLFQEMRPTNEQIQRQSETEAVYS